MIQASEITSIGRLGKPHGISGEINAALDIDYADIDQLSCIVLDIDSIFVPFFISNTRGKGAAGAILKIDGIDTDTEARLMGGKEIFALRSEIDDEIGDDSVERLIGYRIVNENNTVVGTVDFIDDSTPNLLFVLDNGIMVPVADPMIISIDHDTRQVTMTIPEGLIEAQQ